MNVIVACPRCKQKTEVHVCWLEPEQNERLLCRHCWTEFSATEIGKGQDGNNKDTVGDAQLACGDGL